MHCRSAAAFILPALLAATADAEVVYQSYERQTNLVAVIVDGGAFSPGVVETGSAVELPGGSENDSAAGELVTLAGLSRLVTRFDTRLARFDLPSSPQRADVTLTFYQNDGGLPGVAFWSGTLASVPISNSNAGAMAADVTFSPNVTVPDTFVFAIRLDNVVYGALPAALFGPAAQLAAPTVGTAGLSVLDQDTATGVWRYDTSAGVPSYHLQARITAIPAPGSLVLFALGAADAGRVAARTRRR